MKVLVVDDHALIRDALHGIFKELRPEAAIVEAANSRQAMLQLEEDPQIELVLLDLNLPDRDGLEVLAELRHRYQAIAVVVLSAMNDRGTVAKALDLGALGFIPKSAQRDVMLSAFNLIFSGGIYIPPEILGGKVPSPEKSTAALSEREQRHSATDIGLTGRQMEVLALMMQGKSNKAICRLLDLAEPTVKNHVTAILRALNATNRTEAVIAAGELGLGPSKTS